MRRIHLLVLGLAISACRGEARPDTATTTQLSAADARDYSLSASPDGRHIAFWRPGSGGSQLWLADAGLRNARQLNVTTQSATPAMWAGDSRRLTVPASNHSLADVAVVDVATDSVTFLTDSPAWESPVQFHPDGDRVVFVAFTAGGTVNLFTVSQRTRAITALLPKVGGPAVGSVSPDGAHIAYFVDAGKGTTLWVSDSTGGEPRQLTTDGYEFLSEVVDQGIWSPDGKQFLFLSTRTGKSDIWVASVDGTTRQLTSANNHDYGPVWSPDGSRVAFISERGRQRDLWVVAAAGGEAARVTDDALDEAYPVWMDDSTLAYTAGSSPGSFWRRAIGDTAEVRILPDSMDVGGLTESPDRQWMAMQISHGGGGTDLALVRPDGSGLRILSHNAFHGNLRWNRASTKLAWASDQGGSMDAYVADVAGDAAPVRTESWPSYDVPGYWSDDDSSLVIISTRKGGLGDLWRIPLAGGDTTQLSRIGSVLNASTYVAGGRSHVLLQISEQAAGEIALAEWQPGDKLRTIISGNPGMPPQPTGGLLAVMLPGAGRPVLKVLHPDGSVVHSLDVPGVRAFSTDDRQLIVNTQTNGQLDLDLLDVTTGKTTPLTRTPDDETSAMFTAQGDSIVFRRARITSVVMRAGIERVLDAGR
jgi:Tol biopolymer transport system component